MIQYLVNALFFQLSYNHSNSTPECMLKQNIQVKLGSEPAAPALHLGCSDWCAAVRVGVADMEHHAKTLPA